MDIEQLQQSIRHGKEPDNPRQLMNWFDQVEATITAKTLLVARRKIYISQFHLLLDTICDELVSSQWRCLCLNNIYKPLQSLSKITESTEDKRQHQKLLYELSVTSHYMALNLNAPTNNW